MQKIANYQIQEWLFSTANGHFDIDLAESGIHPHHIDDIQFSKNYDLNYSIDVGQQALRQLIAEMYKVDEQRIVITNGSQEALYLFYRSFLSAHDHVITFVPGWQQSWEVPAHIGCDVTKIRGQSGYVCKWVTLLLKQGYSPYYIRAVAFFHRTDLNDIFLPSTNHFSFNTELSSITRHTIHDKK